MRFLILMILLCAIAAFCSCGKTYPDEPSCRKVLILSEKYYKEGLIYRYDHTDTTYQDIVCDNELKKFREAKVYWDALGGFIVCYLDLYEKRIHIIK